MKKASVLVVVPVYNEAENLDHMLGPLMEVVRREHYDLVAIDDASTDDSRAILKRHGVPAITLVENLGAGAAVQTGYKYALAKKIRALDPSGRGWTTRPRFLPMLRQRLAAHDFVIGSRFLDSDAAPFPPERGAVQGNRTPQDRDSFVPHVAVRPDPRFHIGPDVGIQ